MSIQLSSREISRLKDSLDIVLDIDSALRQPDAWALEVLAKTIPLLEADRGFICVPDGNEFSLHFNHPEMVSAATDYLSYYQPRDVFFGPRRIELGLSTFICEDLIEPSEKRTSEHWNDWVIPHRLLDPCGIAIDLDGRLMPAALTLYHERETDRRRFGERGKLLLDAIESAFCRSVYEQLRRRGTLPMAHRLAESVAVPIMMFDDRGALVHRTEAFEARFGTGETGRWVVAEGRRLVADLVQGGVAERSQDRLVTRVRAPSSSAVPYLDLVGSKVPRRAGDGGVVIVAVLEPEVPAPSEIREAFRLTRRESEVAELLGRRRSNREIASALYISPSTARRHTERVLAKLGVGSRRQVPDVLLGLRTDT